MAQGDVLYRSATGWTRLPAGTSGQVLQTNGAAANPSWVTPGAGGISELTGDVTAGPGSGSQAATIPADTVTYAKMQDVSAASKLLGRGDSGAGDPQEISLGSGLSMSGTTISATGGGGNFGPVYPFTPLVDGDYTWINQGGATKSATSAGVTVYATATATELNIRKKTAPSAPYTITAWFRAPLPGTNNTGGGLCFRQSSDGKLVAFHFLWVSGPTFAVEHWNSPTSWASTPLSSGAFYTDLMCLRIEDDNTDRKYYFSIDGQTFLQFYSQGRTTFLTADEVGFFIRPQGTAIYTNWLSWVQG